MEEKARVAVSDREIASRVGEDCVGKPRRKNEPWLRLDRSNPADLSFAHKGRAVLVLDKAVSEAMLDKTLDVKRTESGSRLILK